MGGGQLFEAAAAARKLTPASTPADVTVAMYKIPKGETLGGIPLKRQADLLGVLLLSDRAHQRP